MERFISSADNMEMICFCLEFPFVWKNQQERWEIGSVARVSGAGAVMKKEILPMKSPFSPTFGSFSLSGWQQHTK